MNFEAVIGLEIHVEMKTRSKMFSASPNSFSRKPNSEVTVFDMAFPGTMPRLNKEAVRMAIRVANALHMKIDHELHFDRKNYFYPDLPKGFQITQQRRPIGSDGYLEIRKNGVKKKIGIERIHMEEDTCKQTHFVDYTLLDYNRAGVPLVEIVSRPEMHDGYEAMKYVEAIRNIVVYSGTSDGSASVSVMKNHLKILGHLGCAIEESEDFTELNDLLIQTERNYRYEGLGPDWEKILDFLSKEETLKNTEKDLL